VDNDHLMLDPADVSIEGSYVRPAPSDDEVRELAASLREKGQLQAIGVRTTGSAMQPRYILVYGRTRLEAARRAGMRVLARDHGRLSEEESFEIQALENLAREDMHPVDAAVAVATMLRRGGTQVELGRRIGKVESWISYHRKVGEALLTMNDEERTRLRVENAVGVRDFQIIAGMKLLEQQVQALRARLAGTDRVTHNTRESAAPRAAFRAGVLRGGKGYRVHAELTDSELRDDPEQSIQRVRAFFDEQVDLLRRRAEELRRSGSSAAED
jgi:ParB/RepB/Spo0J family partition protein